MATEKAQNIYNTIQSRQVRNRTSATGSAIGSTLRSRNVGYDDDTGGNAELGEKEYSRLYNNDLLVDVGGNFFAAMSYMMDRKQARKDAELADLRKQNFERLKTNLEIEKVKAVKGMSFGDMVDRKTGYTLTNAEIERRIKEGDEASMQRADEADIVAKGKATLALTKEAMSEENMLIKSKATYAEWVLNNLKSKSGKKGSPSSMDLTDAQKIKAESIAAERWDADATKVEKYGAWTELEESQRKTEINKVQSYMLDYLGSTGKGVGDLTTGKFTEAESVQLLAGIQRAKTWEELENVFAPLKKEGKAPTIEELDAAAIKAAKEPDEKNPFTTAAIAPEEDATKGKEKSKSNKPKFLVTGPKTPTDTSEGDVYSSLEFPSGETSTGKTKLFVNAFDANNRLKRTLTMEEKKYILSQMDDKQKDQFANTYRGIAAGRVKYKDEVEMEDDLFKPFFYGYGEPETGGGMFSGVGSALGKYAGELGAIAGELWNGGDEEEE